MVASGLSVAQPAASQHQLIPAPVTYTAQPGHLTINGPLAVTNEGANSAQLKAVTQWFGQQASRVGLTVDANAAAGKVLRLRLVNKPNDHGAEGYKLEVNTGGISIEAGEPAGIFYGLQSVLQMLPARALNKGVQLLVPCCTMADAPRFGWRGLMLDVSRHFFTVSEVKQYLDVMAHYKLNVLHWHLTDDNGWRIEIKSFPKLTEVGGCRVPRYGTFGERLAPVPGEKATDCGFYTQADIAEVVRYAAERHITIVPEIDVPGHSLAAIAAYPELSITKVPAYVNPGSKFSEWYANGTFKMLLDNTLNPADEKVYAFLDKVFGEVAQLFPGQYIHAGGDECYHGYWEKSPVCQQFMRKNGIKDVHGLQSYFMKRVNAMIAAKGKTMIGWDEIMDGGLADGAAVMSWRGTKGGVEAAKMGHAAVMTPTTHCYLDYMQADATLEPRIYEKLYLKTTYEFEPVPAGVNSSLILGGQGNLWTEKVPTLDHAFYMTYPRALALAEVLWSPASTREWPGFVQRTEAHFERFDQGKTGEGQNCHGGNGLRPPQC
ncbi:MAG: beta-N-acetylhexosaminidase [Bacteroidetes bacterium]|nr:MAG: beta-N-acetylhexosaminidase [Bacteroidota bacterium]